MRACRAVWVLLSGLLLGGVLSAQAPEVERTDLRVTDVAVFKHGYGFVMAEGTAKTRDGWAVFSQVPQASLGTLWLYSPEAGVTVDRTVAEVRETKHTQEAQGLAGLIEANVGARVTIRYGYDYYERSSVLHGLLLPSVYAAPEQYGGQSQQSATDEAAVWAAVPPRPAQRHQAVTYVMLRTDHGDVAIPSDHIGNLTIDREANRQQEVTKPEQVLAARLVREGKTVTTDTPVGMAYLARGLRWIPNYRLQITGDGKARLQLQGDVINDVTDLKDSRLHLVIGVPHFIQQDVLSPLSLQVAWTQLSSYFAPAQGRQQDVYSNALMTQMVGVQGMIGYAGGRGGYGGGGRGAAEEPSEPVAVAPITGEGVEELYFYNVADVTLNRGSRASVSIIDQPVQYEDVYLWNVTDDPDYARRRWSSYYTVQQQQQQSPSPEQLAMQKEALNPKVWHALRAKNETNAPWTTATVLVVKDWQPVSQSLLLYTPVHGSVDITTTVAPDIVSGRTDVEVSRKQGALKIPNYGATYDLVTVKGELRLSNHKAQAVRLIATRQLEGEVAEVTSGGEVEKLAEGYGGINPTSRITWDLPLAAGQDLTLGYTYNVYVRVS